MNWVNQTIWFATNGVPIDESNVIVELYLDIGGVLEKDHLNNKFFNGQKDEIGDGINMDIPWFWLFVINKCGLEEPQILIFIVKMKLDTTILLNQVDKKLTFSDSI